jgi:hypothetical protein
MHPDEAGVERDHLRKALQETQRAYEKLALIGVSLALNVRFTPKSGHRSARWQCPLCAISRHRPYLRSNTPRSFKRQPV